MMAKFVEQVQTYFGQLRDIAIHFSENMTEVGTHYINTKLALQDFEDVPPELLHCMEDREAILNLIAGMKDAHIQRIDEREDRLMVRSRDFIENMIDELNKYVTRLANIMYICTYIHFNANVNCIVINIPFICVIFAATSWNAIEPKFLKSIPSLN